MGTMFSPEQAAKRAGVSRRTVARALATRDLAGVRDNLQRWRIDSDAVDAWAVRRAPMGVATGHAMAYAQTGAHLDAEVVAERDQLRVDLAAARADNAGLRAEVAGVRELLAATTADRDAWRDLARDQARELARMARSWWQRLLDTLRGRDGGG
jgi:excisionase family DNA binding protein